MSENQGNMAQNQTVQKEKKNNPKLGLIVFVIELILLIVGITGCVVLLKSYNNPDRVADNYFDALREGDYATAYSYLQMDDGMEESTFLNADVYASVMEKYGFADEFASIDDSREEIFGETYYVLDAGRGEHTILVTETGKKKWFLFQEYEVCPQDFYAEDVYIAAPKMMTISVNGIDLNESNSTRDDFSGEVYRTAYETAYKIDKMIVGDYRIQARGDMFQTYTEEMTVNPYYNVFMMDTPVLKAGSIDQIAKTVPEMLKSLYQSALNGEDARTAFAAAGLHEPSDDEREQYESLVDDFIVDNGYFTAITLSEFDAYNYGGYFEWDTGEYRTDITMNYTLTYNYDVLDWWTESYYESKEDNSYGYFSCDVIYRNGEWVLEDIYISSHIYIW